MKITVIYGDDTVTARRRFMKIIDVVKTRGWEIIHLDSTNFTLAENFSGNQLFESEKLYVLEDVSKFKQVDIDWLANNFARLDCNLLIFNDGTMNKKLSFIKPKDAKFEEFKLPRKIFNFLDSLSPGNAQQSIRLLHEVAAHDAVELVFSLIGTTMRDLYWANSEPNSLKLPSWRKEKLVRQAKKFTSHQLAKLIAGLAEIDIQVKTSDISLLPSLDLLILSELQ